LPLPYEFSVYLQQANHEGTSLQESMCLKICIVELTTVVSLDTVSSFLHLLLLPRIKHDTLKFSTYRRIPLSTGNTSQDLPQLRETADNTERYIYNVIFV